MTRGWGGTRSGCSIFATNAGESGSTFEPKLTAVLPSRATTYLWKFHFGRSPVACASPSKSGDAPGATDVLPNISNRTA